MPELEEFESKGFVKSSENTNVLARLRKYYGDFRIFKSGLKGCGNSKSSKYGSRKIFGHHLEYYYDIRRKEEFVKYLEEEFYKENPSANTNQKREFTKLLHAHGLHWKGCCKGRTEKNREEGVGT